MPTTWRTNTSESKEPDNGIISTIQRNLADERDIVDELNSYLNELANRLWVYSTVGIASDDIEIMDWRDEMPSLPQVATLLSEQKRVIFKIRWLVRDLESIMLKI